MIWGWTIFAFLATAFIVVVMFYVFSQRHEIWEALRKGEQERAKVSGERRQHTIVKETLERVIDKSFIVHAPIELTWNHVAEIEKWPSWAKHIRSVVKSPAGPLSAESRATLRLSNGLGTSFQMIEFDPPRHWKWAGPFWGSQILYDHIFSQNEPGQTTVRFTVDVGGGPGALLRGIFGRIYRKNLERAVPLLVQEIEAAAGSKS